MNMFKRYRFTFASGALILVALLVPGSTFRTVPRSFLQMDKLVHLALFYIFTLSFLLEYRADRGRAPRFWLGLLVVGVLTVGSEVLQLGTRTRSFDVMDMVYDTAGAILALATAVAISAVSNGKRGG